MKFMSLPDFLTEQQIEAASKLYEQLKDTGRFADECAKQIIEPNIAEINRKIGQENDPRYLSYAVEHVLNQSSK